MMKILYRTNKKIIVTAGLLLITGVFFMVTSPDEMPIVGLMIPFILVFMTVYSIVRTVTNSLSARFAGLLSLVAATFSVLLLLLGSLHQLSFRDVALSVAIVLVLSWYIYRTQKQ